MTIDGIFFNFCVFKILASPNLLKSSITWDYKTHTQLILIAHIKYITKAIYSSSGLK